MRIAHKNDRLIVRDQPLLFWIFYSCFIAGGTVALFFSLSAAPDTTTTLIGSLIGVGNIAGGVYMFQREPASLVVFDPKIDMVTVCRWYPVGKRTKGYRLSTLTLADVQTTTHTDGGDVYRPRFRLGKSKWVPISMFWYQTKTNSDAVVDEIRRFLKFTNQEDGRN